LPSGNAPAARARIFIDQVLVALHRHARTRRLRQADVSKAALAILDLADERILSLELRGERGEEAVPAGRIDRGSVELVDRSE
jgi:hypothetical protein